MDAIYHYDLAPSARVSFQTKTRFWREDPLGALGGLNMIGTDTPAERIWNTSELQPDPTMVMLHAYMIDRRALTLAAVPEATRVATTLDTIAQFLPRLRDQVVATSVKVWQEDPAFQPLPLPRRMTLHKRRAHRRTTKSMCRPFRG